LLKLEQDEQTTRGNKTTIYKWISIPRFIDHRGVLWYIWSVKIKKKFKRNCQSFILYIANCPTKMERLTFLRQTKANGIIHQ
jgi:hypothetical protein